MKSPRLLTLTFSFACILLTGFSNEESIFVVDTSKSKIRWTGYYLFSFGEHYGSVQIAKGQLVVTNQQLTGGYFDIDMTTIRDLDMPENDGGKDLSDHLKGDDFFAAAKFPVSRLDIVRAEKINDSNPGDPNYDIMGELTLKGVTKPIKFQAFFSQSTTTVEANAKLKFDRTKWGVHYNSGKVFSDIGDGAISDAIALEIEITATSK